jgi:hypothetical protein
MMRRANTLPHVQTKDGPVKNTATHIALGHAYSADGRSRVSISNRIACATGSFHALHPLWGDPNVTLKIKIDIYEGILSGVALHGCETASFAEIAPRITTFNHQCLARITGRDMGIIAKKNPLDAIVLLRRRQIGFIGHTLRAPPTSLPQRALLTRIPAKPATTTQRPPFGQPLRTQHNSAEPSSVTYPLDYIAATQPDYIAAYGPPPELIDFEIDKKHIAFTTSTLNLLPHKTFAELFDHAQDRKAWRSWVRLLTKHSKDWPPAPPTTTTQFTPMGNLDSDDEAD